MCYFSDKSTRKQIFVERWKMWFNIYWILTVYKGLCWAIYIHYLYEVDMIIIPILSMRYWGLRKLINLPKAIQLINSSIEKRILKENVRNPHIIILFNCCYLFNTWVSIYLCWNIPNIIFLGSTWPGPGLISGQLHPDVDWCHS